MCIIRYPLIRNESFAIWSTQIHLIFALHHYRCAGIAQSVQRIATGWTARGSNPGGDEIFRTCPDRPWGPPSLLYNQYAGLSRGWSRRGVALTTHPSSSSEVKEIVELYLYSSSGSSWPVLRWTSPLPLPLPLLRDYWEPNMFRLNL